MSITINTILLDRYHAARREWDLVQRMVADEIISQVPFPVGAVVRDRDTGARYEIEGGNGWLSDGQVPHCSLRAHRVYSTGRRPARATTYLNPSNLELVK